MLSYGTIAEYARIHLTQHRLSDRDEQARALCCGGLQAVRRHFNGAAVIQRVENSGVLAGHGHIPSTAAGGPHHSLPARVPVEA